ncbi:hypothetical protein [Tautonia marina]|uniref:hypothetical protein n=1 Tax=Tautonia marina TaxID=2653855 RepID=UPI001375FB06|nr:hypothetical protein [Tautonia marina]
MFAFPRSSSAPTMPVIPWPTYKEDGPSHLPADAFNILYAFTAQDLPARVAALSPPYPVLAGRRDPADDCIDWREPVG